MPSTFKASYKGIGDMLNDEFMVEAMKARAERVKARAVATAPVETGRYKESFEVEAGTHGGDKKDRAYGRVTNTAPYAYQVEFGDKYVAKHRTLGKALDAAGGE